MTDASKNIGHPLSMTAQIREAKQFSWNCFLKQGNALLLIAATLIPIVMFMAGQGIYSMLYYAMGTPDSRMNHLLSVANILLTAITLPLIGGLMYIITGIAHGKPRHLRDIFYSYTSVRAWLRTWVAIAIPSVVLAAIVGIIALSISLTEGMVELTGLMEPGPALLYGDYFRYAGILLTVLIAVIGWIVSGVIVPFFWLVFSMPNEQIGIVFVRSIARMRGRLVTLVCLQLSFFGWLLLSVATAGILLVIFVIPFYLLTVTRFVDGLADELNA